MRFTFIFLMSLIVIACSKQAETPVNVGNKNQILHVGNGGEPQDLDPHITTGMPEYRIQRAIFEGLTARDGKTLEVVPAAAESWTISQDKTKYTFAIRENAKWSNGDELTAHDFVWSWKRALMPKLANPYAYQLFIIENAEDFSKGKVADFSQVGIKALDDKTLEVVLKQPVPYFLGLLDHHSMYPVHPKTVEANGRMDERGNPWTRPENFVGNGPFVVDTWQVNKVLSVKKNSLYWDQERVKLNEVHYYPIQHSGTEERMFRTGQLHIINELSQTKIPVYRNRQDPAYRTFPYFGVYFYRLNVTVKPLDDARVRKALAYSIDRKTITEKITNGFQPPAFNFTPPDTNGYTAEARMVYDPELAKKLLKEAGFPNGEGFPALTILYNTLEGHKKIALAVQAMWKEVLGINVLMENQDWKVYLSNQHNMNYEITRSAWIGDYYDPNTFLDLFVTNGTNNYTGWSNSNYDEYIKKAANSNEQQERYKYFQKAERILIEEAPIIPVYTYKRNFLVSTSVKNWHDDILDYHYLKDVYLEEEL